MFEFNYRIVLHDYDDFKGQEGFFQIKCNDLEYGDIYSKEIERFMFTETLYDWFERMIEAVYWLKTKEFVAVSDVESYDIWITFKRIGDDVTIGIRRALKKDGTQGIEFELHEAKAGEWNDQTVSYNQLKEEVQGKCRRYLCDLNDLKVHHKYIENLKGRLVELMKE